MEPSNILESVKEEPRIILSYDELIKTIPFKNIVYHQDVNLLDTHTEWMWKFYNINNRQVVVISKKDPNKEKLYMRNNGEWGEHIDEHLYEKYIVITLYCYTK